MSGISEIMHCGIIIHMPYKTQEGNIIMVVLSTRHAYQIGSAVVDSFAGLVVGMIDTPAADQVVDSSFAG